MYSIDVRTEKANVMLRYRSFQTFMTLFRFMEICVFLIVISTFTSQIPFTVRVSVDYLTGISVGGISPKLVFVIGNMIILILLYKSRVAGDLYRRIDVYDECVRRCEKSVVNRTNDDIVAVEIKKKICRSQSEKMMRGECNNSQRHRKLTRSVTERRVLKDFECCGGVKPSPEICWSQSEKVKPSPEICRCQSEKVKPSPEICRSQSEKMMSVESDRKLLSSAAERKILKNFECCGGEKPSPEICRSQSEKVKPSPEICRSQSEKISKNFECCGGEKLSPEICRSQSEKAMSVESDRKLTRSVTERRIMKDVECCGGEKLSPEYCRSQSEKMMRVECNDGQSYRNLRRSVTEGGVEELSSEAFRRTVEAFIARQQQSLRDEELAPVPHVGA